MQYKLLIDIGNSSIKLSFYAEQKPKQSFSLASDSKMSIDSYGLQLLTLLNYLQIQAQDIQAAYICSVVPQLNGIISQAIEKYMQSTVYFVPENIAVPLNNKYGNPNEVGADRLVASYAARKLYPKSKAIISIDFGTATTFDCVENNDYLGGLIAPGLLSSRDSLARLTAKLPRTNLDIEAKSAIIGQNTVTSINHGFLFGFVAMSEGLVVRLKKELGSDCIVVASGGFVHSLAKHTKCFDYIEPDLILEGLRLLSQ